MLLGALGCVLPRVAHADDAVERAVFEAPCAREPALSASAEHALAHHAPLDTTALRALAEDHGLPAASVRAWVGRGDEAAVARLAAEWVAQQHDGAPTAWRRCAVAHQGALWAVALAPRVAQIDGLARALPSAAARSRVRVLLPAGARAPRVVIAAPSGATDVRAADATGALDLALDRGDGLYTVQLVGDTARGPLPFATWHVTVGEAPHAPATAAATREAAATRDEIADPRRVLAAINRARARAGVLPLRPDPLLAQLAHERAVALAARGAVVHALDPNDTPAARLLDAHVGADRLAENVARARSLGDASARLDASPAHRANRLDPSLDAAGIGAAVCGASVYLVELFAARPRITE